MSPPEKHSDFESFEEPAGPAQSQAGRTIYSVSELTARIKSLLESNFPFVWVCGEVSNYRMPASGHCYFTLKDENAQIAAVVFRAQYRQARVTLADGMSIIGLGRLSVYEPRGNYQVILEYLEPAGLGALQLAFETLKRRLAAEGYFDPRHKKPLPFMPAKISVVTSPSGAVVHDIINVLSRRFPNLAIEIVPVNVQGPRAEAEIINALALVSQRADSDVVILARGGGSLEDLQAFNSESVAMAVFHCQIPVVSAIGHETDVTIADFIADLRAPTPSAAAELVAPEKKALLRQVAELDRALHRSFLMHLEKLNNDLRKIRVRLKDPRKKIQEVWLRLDDLGGRLQRSLGLRIRHSGDHLKWLLHRFGAVSPLTQVQKHDLELNKNNNNLFNSFNKYISDKKSALHEHTLKLEGLNPLAILGRGYSIARTLPERRVITDPGQVDLHENVEVLLAGGVLWCEIKGKSTHGEKNV